MSKVLARLSIPPRLRDGMMLKTGYPNTFDVPNTKEGVLFLEFWKNASAAVRDAMMKRAYDEEVPIITIKSESDEEGDTAGVESDAEDDEDDEDEEEDD